MHVLITLDGKGYALIRTYALINTGVTTNYNSYTGIDKQKT